MEIIWKNVPGYSGRYQASNTGEVRCINFRGLDIIHILSQSNNADGYKVVALDRKPFRVHRIIAMTFLENPFNKETVNHKDGNKQNNHADNLEWSTRSENVQHAFDTGLKFATKNHHFYTNHPKTNLGKFGHLNKTSKIIHQYSIDGVFIKEWYGGYEIKRELGFHQGAISACCLGKNKTHKGFVWKYINT